MSEIDKVYQEREARRLENERERQQRFDAAMAFVREFYERDVAPSKALASNDIEAKITTDRILFHRTGAGIYADAFQIAVGQDGAIDIAGRSLGQYGSENKVKLRRELIEEMLTFFDL